MNYKKIRERGFTLLESIITLVIVAIMATMIFTYSGSKSFSGSVTPIQGAQSAMSIHQIMERITADYQGYPHWKPNTTTYTTGSKVTPIKRDGYFYQLVSASCPNSGTVEPSWTLVVTACTNTTCVADAAGCKWTRPNTTGSNPNPIMPLATLKTRITGTPGSGGINSYSDGSITGMQYKIVSNHYINPTTAPTSWDVDAGAITEYLKVTIQEADGGEKLTAIFTKGSLEP